MVVSSLYNFLLSNSTSLRLKHIREHTKWHKEAKPNDYHKHDLGEHIDRVYAISLPSRVDRVIQQLKNGGDGVFQSASILNAFNKKDMDLAKLQRQGYLDNNDRLWDFNESKRLGFSGCHMSHIGVLLDFLRDKNAKHALVFEDDIVIDWDKTRSFIKSMDPHFKPHDVDMVYFGYCLEGKHTPIVQNEIDIIENPMCRHAYIINRRAAEILTQGAYPLDQTGDRKTIQLMSDHGIKVIGPPADNQCVTQGSQDEPSLKSSTRNVDHTVDNKKSNKNNDEGEEHNVGQSQLHSPPYTFYIMLFVFVVCMLIVLCYLRKKTAL